MNTLKTPEQVAEQTATEYHLFLEDSNDSSDDAAYLVERIATTIRADRLALLREIQRRWRDTPNNYRQIVEQLLKELEQ